MPKKKVLLISPENWGKNFVSKHHYAKYLSKNFEVFFLQNPENWLLENAFHRKLIQSEVSDSLRIISLPNQIMRLNNLPESVQKRVYAKQAQEIHKQLGIPYFNIVWSFDPHKYWNLSIWNTNNRIYHTVDFHPDAKFEKVSCQTADLVVGVADLIIDPLKGYHPNTIKITHGADIDNFDQSDKSLATLPGTNLIKAGYVGNFHRHIDYPLLYNLAETHKEVDFIMIGPFDPNNLNRSEMIEQTWLNKFYHLENVYFTGSVPSHELMNHMLNFDISMVLFDESKARIHCNPHKMMGYFYAGNVVISSFIDEYKDHPNKLIRMAKKNADLPQLFKQVLENITSYNQPDLQKFRRDFTLSNSYNKQIERILTMLPKKEFA